MAAELRQPRQHVIAASATILALAGLLAAPVLLAAPERDLLCNASTDPMLAVSPIELTATPVNNNDELLESHLLRPRAKAAVRGAFSNEVPGDDGEIEAQEVDADESATPDPSAHSALETKRPVYKRRMYRRDI
jgi:hypothetical protein